ncbi:MAG: DNA (cytosine-5-)-methyltransferase [Urechidicola sp.]|nr:DNA (cytosine-5-)-methyltransferase [Urechidicola sp.]
MPKLANNDHTYTVGSLFAGVGGICHAFKNISCDILWANEIDSNACKTYKINNKNTDLLECDIKDLYNRGLQGVDILTAGFPCQPFSQAGHGKGFDDERGELFFEVPKLLKKLKPKAYLLENVRTLSTHNGGKSFDIVKNEMLKAGYSFIPFVLNAAKYTDIPQGRERIYIVGFKNESDYFYNNPVKTNDKEVEGCFLSKSFNIPKAKNKPHQGIKSFLENKVDQNYFYSNPDNRIHQKIRNEVITDDTVYQYRRYYVRKNKSNVCPTLTANMGGGGHNIPIVLDGKIPRKLTPKECFNLQGFPADFKLPSIAKGQLYKQAGNSVVIPMVQKIAKEITRVLNENAKHTT